MSHRRHLKKKKSAVEGTRSYQLFQVFYLISISGLCSEKSLNKYTLIEHLAVHSDDSNCQICLEPSNSKSELLAHRMQHVPDNQKGCLFCDRAFLNTASLQFHYMTVHKVDKSVSIGF